MTAAVMLLAYGILWAALMAACGRGQRPVGTSWFDVVHEMRGTSKKARGRMQQRKKRRS